MVKPDSLPLGTQTMMDPVTVCNSSAPPTDTVEDAVIADAVVVDAVVVDGAGADGINSLVVVLESERRPTMPAERLVIFADNELVVIEYTGVVNEMPRDVEVGSLDRKEVVLATFEWAATGVLLFDAEKPLVSDAVVLSGWRDPTIPTGDDLAELLPATS